MTQPATPFDNQIRRFGRTTRAIAALLLSATLLAPIQAGAADRVNTVIDHAPPFTCRTSTLLPLLFGPLGIPFLTVCQHQACICRSFVGTFTIPEPTCPDPWLPDGCDIAAEH